MRLAGKSHDDGRAEAGVAVGVEPDRRGALFSHDVDEVVGVGVDALLPAKVAAGRLEHVGADDEVPFGGGAVGVDGGGREGTHSLSLALTLSSISLSCSGVSDLNRS